MKSKKERKKKLEIKDINYLRKFQTFVLIHKDMMRIVKQLKGIL